MTSLWVYCVCMLVTQLCPDLCDSMGCSPSGSSVHRILQARILEWVAIPISRGSSWPRDWTQVSCIEGRLLTVWATRYINCIHFSAPKAEARCWHNMAYIRCSSWEDGQLAALCDIHLCSWPLPVPCGHGRHCKLRHLRFIILQCNQMLGG